MPAVLDMKLILSAMSPLRRRQVAPSPSASETHTAVPRPPTAPNDYYGALFIDAKQIESTVQIGRDDERSSDTGLAFVVSRRLGRSVGAWDPA